MAARGGLGALCACGVAAGLTVACGEAPVERAELEQRLAGLEQPNVVLFLVDTLRADWTTPHGFEHDTTPELQRWAQQGAVFERALAQSSWTKTSMTSLLTSLWPRAHGVKLATDGLASGALSLAEVFSAAGYASYGVQTNGWLHQSFGFKQGFDRYSFPTASAGARFPQPAVWPHADRVYEETVRLLEGHEGDEPFFLYLHFMDVHQYAAPREFQRFGTDTRGQYLASIRWVDDVVQRVRELLERQRRLERSVLVFASDHGETFGENGIHGHAQNVLTKVLQVPLVIRFPFPLEPLRVSEQVRNLDVAPTLLEIAGIPVPDLYQGRSMVGLMTGGDRSGDRTSYASLDDLLFVKAVRQLSVNDGSWSFARNTEDGAEFLFDRVVDPGENVNLVEREPEQAARMRRLLDAYLAGEPFPETRVADVRVDPNIARLLRALGYLE